jgi:Na+/H+ antiporter NhaD/arsenite permease-like protein
MFSIIPQDPPLWLMAPFLGVLASVALGPLILRHHWEKHYQKLCLGLAAVPSLYYIFVFRAGARVAHAGLEYFSFMVVVGSFFVVAGGIHLRVRGEATPVFNTLFLLGGALLGNIIGTTGASMLLVRPWIAMNKTRFTGMHLAFFIFVVSNIGGALLPVGPPLFLGYLKGVPFWWPLLRCWPQWLTTIVAVLAIFYTLDAFQFRARSRLARPSDAAVKKWHCDGGINLVFMVGILAALIVAPAGWREVIMGSLAVVAYLVTPPRIHQANEFSFLPIKEVGWLFLGIFGTMIPVLDYMELHARDLGLHTDLQFFWATGILSAMLDNAPTYLTFLAGALGLHDLSIEKAQDLSEFVARHDHYLVAISLGATFFGALTYIGNGPNLLVKAITDRAGVKTPGFFGFVFKFAIPVLAPVFVLVSLLFFWR